MNNLSTPMDIVHMVGKLADLKDEHYKNTLVISALIELLIEKEVITRDELIAKSSQLDYSAFKISQ